MFRKFQCLFSVASLLCTGYTTKSFTVQQPGREEVSMLILATENTRLRKYIDPCNASVCVLLIISAVFVEHSDDKDSMWIICFVPSGA